MSSQVRRVSAELAISVVAPARMSLQVAVTGHPSDQLAESLEVTSDGVPVEVQEIAVPGMGRVHACNPPPGPLQVSYSATVTGRSDEPRVSAAERVVYRRASRYAESDRLAPIAQAEFDGITDAAELVGAVSSWVGGQLTYMPGSSGPTDGAVDTMLKRRGVCRDYAHLVIALLRSLDIPARLCAVYAPGLDPMDFHAVVEVAVGDVWRVVDATLLAPRSSLVRIGAGRDAADTAFLSTYGGQVDLLESVVTATIDGSLPSDDVTELVSLG